VHDRSAIEAVQNAVWFAMTFAQIGVLIAFLSRHIAAQFKIFCIYVATGVLRTCILRYFGGEAHTLTYRTLWSATEPIFLLLQIMVVLEFHRVLYRSYPGIEAFARILLLCATVVALLVTFGTVQLDVGRIVWTVPDVQRLFVVKRLVSSLLGLLLLITMAFFPSAPSTSNVRLHGWLLSGFFIASAGGFFGINFGLRAPWMGTMFMTVQLGCFILWSLCVRPISPVVERPTPETIARTERWNRDLVFLAKWLID
jgi:hypothetical protein